MSRRPRTLALCLAAACGSSAPARPDAHIGSGPIDAATADGPAADAAIAALPDLTVNADRARLDLALHDQTFTVDSCELDPDEACVDQPGTRRLLHFSVETPNLGTADLELGAPSPSNPEFQYSTCHMHYHFLGYAEYHLRDAGGVDVASGHKQAFCLLDSARWSQDPSVADQPKYNCDFQGIQRGWADVYHSRLPCQYIDVTDVAPGAYTLEIRLNQAHAIAELDYANDVIDLPVDLASADLLTPTEPCPTDLATGLAQGTNRECGWAPVATLACAPGAHVQVACADGCGLGTCTGDPMLRLCDPAEPDGNCSFPAEIGSNDDACGGSCPRVPDVVCPPSGQIAAFTAPFRVGDASTCVPALAAAVGP